MENEERFLRSISSDLENLQLRLNERLNALQTCLDALGSDPHSSPNYQSLYILADRIDSARVHMYVAGEYLKGNGERAFIQDEHQVLGYIESLRA